MKNHGYEPQSKLWKLFRSKLRGIKPSAARDCSTYKFQCTTFLKFESHNKGFTLVELLLVIILIGIILVLAVPSLRDTLTGDDLKKSTRLLIGLERKLRAEAVRDQINYLLCFDLSTASYWVIASDMTSEKQNEMKKQMKQLPAGVKILDIVDDKGKKNSETEVRIKFSKNNVCAPTVIHLGSGEDKMTIVINPFLGITDIYDKYIDIVKIATEQDIPGFRKTL